MRMQAARIAFVAVALAVPGSARAQEHKASQHEVLVGDSGGQYEIRVMPSILTSLFFFEKIVGVLPSDRNFSIKKLGSNAVAVRPLSSKKGLRGSVVITTRSLRITVVLRVVDDDAHGMVTFKKASVEKELERRISKEVARRMAIERARMRKQIEASMAAQVHRGVSQRRLRAIDRNNDNVIVSCPRIVRVGGSSYLVFRIESRSSSYQLAEVKVLAGRTNRAGAVVIDGKPARGPVLADIAPKQTIEGVVVLRGASRLRRPTVTLVVSETGGRRAVRVTGVRIR